MSLSRKSAIGADWTGADLTLVKGSRARRGVAFHTLYKSGTGQPEKTAALWAEIQYTQQKGRTILAAALPVHCASILTVTAPFASPSKARRVWPSLLDLQLPFAIEESVFSIVEAHPLPDGRTMAKAIVARRGPVRNLLERMSSSGATPNHLDFEGLALWSQSLHEKPNATLQYPRIVASVSANRVTVVVGRGKQFETAFSAQGCLLKTAEAGGMRNRIVRSLRAVLQPSDLSLSWFWTGSSLSNFQDIESVQSALEAELGAIRWQIHEDPDTFLARALARRALKPDVWPCSLMTGDLVPPIETELTAQRVRRASRLCFTAASLLLLLNGFASYQMARQDAISQETLTAAAQEATGASYVPPKFELQTVRTFAERRRTDRAPIERAFQPPLTDTVRSLAAAAEKDSIRMEQLDLSSEKAVISGWTDHTVTGASVREAMEERGYVSLDAGSVETQDGRTTLRYTMERRP